VRGGGFSLVEVLVATSLLALEALGWLAVVRLTRQLLSATGALLDDGDDGALMAACGAALVPLRRTLAPSRASGATSRRTGVTLVELLIALALTTALLTALAAYVRTAAHAAAAHERVSEELNARLALPALVADVLAEAGAGLHADECGLAIADGGARVLVWSRTPGSGEPAPQLTEVFAARDGGGRPALYLRTPPSVRQPWIEDVTGFSIAAVEHDAGGRGERLALQVQHRAVATSLEVEAHLPHRPCLEAAP